MRLAVQGGDRNDMVVGCTVWLIIGQGLDRWALVERPINGLPVSTEIEGNN